MTKLCYSRKKMNRPIRFLAACLAVLFCAALLSACSGSSEPPESSSPLSSSPSSSGPVDSTDSTQETADATTTTPTTPAIPGPDPWLTSANTASTEFAEMTSKIYATLRRDGYMALDGWHSADAITDSLTQELTITNPTPDAMRLAGFWIIITQVGPFSPQTFVFNDSNGIIFEIAAGVAPITQFAKPLDINHDGALDIVYSFISGSGFPRYFLVVYDIENNVSRAVAVSTSPLPISYDADTVYIDGVDIANFYNSETQWLEPGPTGG